jgi:glycosyltransferase involved in cell wall biosynthesis
MNLKISLLISTYNRPDLLKKALTSAGAQTRPPDEVIVADDGSKEDMIVAIEEVFDSLPFTIKYVTQADDGFRLAKVRNNGVRIATGDLIISSDQDIIFSKGYIETFARSAQKGYFIVSYPVRLDEEQTKSITVDRIKASDFSRIVSTKQLALISKQYRKDLFYRVMHALKLRRIGPKLRGGVFAVLREDYMAVNGFDENFQGWGNEDDDLGLRLNAYGVTGKNPFKSEYPLHLYHPTHNEGNARPNKAYYQEQKKLIAKGSYICDNGINSPLGSDEPVVTEFKK